MTNSALSQTSISEVATDAIIDNNSGTKLDQSDPQIEQDTLAEIPLPDHVNDPPIDDISKSSPATEDATIDTATKDDEEDPNNEDEFASFNEAQDEDDDDEFGDFDEFDDFNTIQENTNVELDSIRFDETVFSNNELSMKNLSETLDKIFSQIHPSNSSQSRDLFTERSHQVYTEISRMPKLKPPNWLKLKIRHNLLISLGIPINLDDFNEGKDSEYNHEKPHKRASLQPEDIDWSGFTIPSFELLNISPERKEELLQSTSDTLSKFETDNLNNTSLVYMEAHDDDMVNAKLAQFQENYNQLIELSSVWNNQLQELQKNFEIYESVVQNTIGYSQKLKRDELLEDLKKLSKSKQKKKLRM